jgi:hypothetical protein
MGFVINVANLIQKSPQQIPKPDSWSSFVEGELELSNKNNEFNLGGYSRP